MTLSKIYTVIKRDGLFYTTKRAFAFAVAKLPLGSRLSFSFYRGLRLHFAPSMLTYVLFANPAARDEDTRVIEKFVSPGDVVVDVGAHIGSTALVAALHAGRSGKVIAVEASPKFYEILINNIACNQHTDLARLHTHQVALGDQANVIVHLNESVSDDTTNRVASHGTAVTQTTLDAITTNDPVIDFLKIDVEGYEPEVLAGARKTLVKTKVIYIEFYSANMRSQSTETDIIQTLEEHFNLFVLQENKLVQFQYLSGAHYTLDLIGIRKETKS